MTKPIIHIEGVAYWRIASAAQAYSVEESFVLEIYRRGLLGEGRRVEGELLLPEEALDRLAWVYRQHFIFGMTIERLEEEI
ncbi:MAG TPA: hypothetical protein ENK02_08830 [Planctomycetes bacterium]|nr:hypothetical protein [Planctomycetota bacterium]